MSRYQCAIFREKKVKVLKPIANEVLYTVAASLLVSVMYKM